MSVQRIGHLLHIHNVIHKDALVGALLKQRNLDPLGESTKLGAILCSDFGLDPTILFRYLAIQYNVPFVGQEAFQGMEDEAIMMVDGGTAQIYSIIPLGLDVSSTGEHLRLATCDTDTLAHLDEVAQLLGREIRVVFAPEQQVKDVIRRYYISNGESQSFIDSSSPAPQTNSQMGAQPVFDGNAHSNASANAIMQYDSSALLEVPTQDVDLILEEEMESQSLLEFVPDAPMGNMSSNNSSGLGHLPPVNNMDSVEIDLGEGLGWASEEINRDDLNLLLEDNDSSIIENNPVVQTESTGENELFGKYMLRKRISSGAIAEIFKASLDGVEGFTRTVAIKRILPMYCDNDDFVKMLVAEAKTAAHLIHQNICKILELGRIGEQYYICMEYVDGFNLATIIEQSNESKNLIPPQLAVYIVQKVAEALDYAHRQGLSEDGKAIVHRDICPSNIMISRSGDVKVIDFGIARAIKKGGEKLSGTVGSSANYIAPEVLTGGLVDGRCDIFSAGAVLFECLAHRKLYPGNSQLEVIKAIESGSKLDIKALQLDLPEKLIEIIEKAIEPAPADRYSDSEDMSDELQRSLMLFGPHAHSRELAEYIDVLFGT